MAGVFARAALALIAGILLYYSLGLTPLWWAAWLAPIPLLLAAFHASAREARWLVFLAAGMGVSSEFDYYRITTGTGATAIIILLQVLAWGFYVNRARAAVRRSKSWTTVFVFPITMAAVDTVVSAVSPHGTAGSFAYTQMDALNVIQVASLLGAPSIVFVVTLFASTIAISIYQRWNIEKPALAYGLPVLIIAVVIGFGGNRVAHPEPASIIKVGLVSVDDFIGPSAKAGLAETVWRTYETSVTALAKQGARVIVLPEKIDLLSPEPATRRQAALGLLAKRTSVYLVAGIQINDKSERYNVAWLFSPAGKLMAEYRKQHLVPYLEHDLTPGDSNIVRTIAGAPFGLAICRDLMFSGFGRQYGKLGVSGLLVPAWDFYRDAWMASAWARLRGLENGYAVVRAGREGYLSVSDKYGRSLDRERSDFLPGRTLLTDMPLYPPRPTVYALIGDDFGWLCVLLFGASLFHRHQSHIRA